MTTVPAFGFINPASGFPVWSLTQSSVGRLQRWFLLSELNLPCTGQVMTILCSPSTAKPLQKPFMFGRRLGSLSVLRLSCSSITMKWVLALFSPASVWSLVFQIAYAAVDCAKGQNHDLCKQEGVDGYPTFNYYNYGKFVEKYTGDRGVSESKSHHLVQGAKPPQPVLPCKWKLQSEFLPCLCCCLTWMNHSVPHPCTSLH